VNSTSSGSNAAPSSGSKPTSARSGGSKP
jgi:hypothetical protein